jgi:hypothetical protein
MVGVFLVLSRYYFLKSKKEKKLTLISLTWFLKNNIHLEPEKYKKNT